jgi:hypothetical protein
MKSIRGHIYRDTPPKRRSFKNLRQQRDVMIGWFPDTVDRQGGDNALKDSSPRSIRDMAMFYQARTIIPRINGCQAACYLLKDVKGFDSRGKCYEK